MRGPKYTTLLLLVLLITFMGLTNNLLVLAQQSPSQIIISGSDASSAPTIRLHVYAIDDQGRSMVLDEQSLIVQHDGNEITNVSIASPYEGGTFTVFVIDIPEGVANQIPIIQEAIQQYASEPMMKEQVDYVAIFTVDELAAAQLMQPENFHNSVRNAFATPLAPKSGATALVDSVMGLINNLDNLKPRPDLVVHLVLMTDGTDVVSTQFESGDVPKRAAELGIPIHTITLDNQNLSQEEKATGREYLSQIATGTRAFSTTLTTAEDLRPLWEQISAFRNQTTLQYTASEATGGDHSVEISLRSNPAVNAATSVTFPPGAPSVTINLPPDSRNLTLQNLDQPVTISLTASVTWLDGVARNVEKAQLLVNGVVAQDIDVDSLEKFDASLDNLTYGANQLQIAIVDDQGSRAVSPEMTLNVAQGETQIPQEVAPTSLPERIWARVSGAATFIGGCFLILFLLILMAGLTVAARKSPILRRLGIVSLMRRIPFLRQYFQDAYQIQGKVRQAERVQGQFRRYSSDVRGARQESQGAAVRRIAFLEILDSTTQLPSRQDLDAVEVRLGRSANQADIVFKNDRTVSRVHATIVQEGSDYRIYDEQSTSGTWVNEQRVPEYGLQLMDGDEIRLGAVRLRFRRP